jgi:hypothetical protein
MWLVWIGETEEVADVMEWDCAKKPHPPLYGVTFRGKNGSMTHHVWTMNEERETEMTGKR